MSQNMIFMKKLFTILVAATLAAGCLQTETRTEETFETNSTVNAYFKFIRMVENEMPVHGIMAADTNTEEMVIMLSLVGDNIGSVYDVMNSPNGDKAQAYKAAQEKYGDFNPNPSVFRFYEKRKGGGEWRIESGNCVYYAFSEKVVSISITSDSEWTKDYPAGKELAPLFTVEYRTLADYIKDGFKDGTTTVRRAIVSELKAEEINPLLECDWNIYGGTDMSFHTSTLPEDYYKHKITIAFTLDTGEVVKYTDTIANILIW